MSQLNTCNKVIKWMQDILQFALYCPKWHWCAETVSLTLLCNSCKYTLPQASFSALCSFKKIKRFHIVTDLTTYSRYQYIYDRPVFYRLDHVSAMLLFKMTKSNILIISIWRHCVSDHFMIGIAEKFKHGVHAYDCTVYVKIFQYDFFLSYSHFYNQTLYIVWKKVTI